MRPVFAALVLASSLVACGNPTAPTEALPVCHASHATNGNIFLPDSEVTRTGQLRCQLPAGMQP